MITKPISIASGTVVSYCNYYVCYNRRILMLFLGYRGPWGLLSFSPCDVMMRRVYYFTLSWILSVH